MKCPQCFEEGLEGFIGGQFGQYACRKCGYVGPIALEDEPKGKK